MAGSEPLDAASSRQKKFVKRINPDNVVASPGQLWAAAVQAGKDWDSALDRPGAVADDDQPPNYPRIVVENLDALQPEAAVTLAELAHAGHDEGQSVTYLGEPLDVRGSIYLEAAALALEGALDDLRESLPEPEDRYPKVKAIDQTVRRACQTAREIAVLIRCDLPIAAWARWRAVFECRVIARVLASGDDQDAKVFLLHSRLESTKALAGKASKQLKNTKKSMLRLGFRFDPGYDVKSLVAGVDDGRRASIAALQEIYPPDEAVAGALVEPRCDYSNPDSVQDHEWARRLLWRMDIESEATTPSKFDFTQATRKIGPAACSKCTWSGIPVCPECEESLVRDAPNSLKVRDLVFYLERLRKARPGSEDDALVPLYSRSRGALRGYNLFDEPGLMFFHRIANQASHAEYVSEKSAAEEELVIVSPTFPLFPGLLACEDLLTMTAVVQRVVYDLSSEVSPSEDFGKRFVDGMLGIALSLLANGHRHFVDEVQRVFKGVSYWGPNPLPGRPGLEEQES